MNHLINTQKKIQFQHKTTGITDLKLKVINPSWSTIKEYNMVEKTEPVTNISTGWYETTIPGTDLSSIGEYVMKCYSVNSNIIGEYEKLNVLEYDFSTIFDILKNDKRITVYNLYTDETNVDIVFAFQMLLDAMDQVEIRAFRTSDNVELYTSGNYATKINGRIASWSTTGLPIRPNEPINILLRAKSTVTQQECCAVIQYKSRITSEAVQNSNTYATEFGVLII